MENISIVTPACDACPERPEQPSHGDSPGEGDRDDPSPFLGRHHARLHDPSIPYHVVSKIFQSYFLLTPTDELNRIIAGVIGRAQEVHTGVRFYACAFLSNHVHMMLQGPADQVPAFIGFVKREISRRWGAEIGWSDGMWTEYESTALPTAESQVHCLRYILSQGVKEGLVAAPEDWPGVHCAKQLFLGQPLEGRWLNGTRYAKAAYKHRKKHATPLAKDAYYEKKVVRFDVIPAWADLTDSERRELLAEMRVAIVGEGETLRNGSAPLGRAALQSMPRTMRRPVPRPPWWEKRRRFICWAEQRAPETRAYLAAYWAFQRAFVVASEAYRRGDNLVEFPAGAFRPSRFERMVATDPGRQLAA